MQHHDSFWDFSFKIHGQPGVDSACLSLQDQSGYDVTMTLACLYAALNGGPALTADNISALLARFAAWREGVVGPLRNLRRELKSSPYNIDTAKVMEIRERIKVLELDTERLMVEAIEPHLTGTIARDDAAAAATARANLAAYAQAATLAQTTREVPALEVLLTALAAWPTATS